MHHGVFGVHLAVHQHTRELVVRRELVEHRRNDYYSATRGGVSLLLRLGASQREGDESEEDINPEAKVG